MTDPTDQGTFVFGNRMADCEGRIQPVDGYLKRWDIKHVHRLLPDGSKRLAGASSYRSLWRPGTHKE
jgi:hypothetical protein